MSLSVRWWAGWGALLALPLVSLVALLLSPGFDRSVLMGGPVHFYVVAGIALAAAVACAVIVGLTQSLHETRLVFLGLAFLSIGAIFAVHGLGTPGFIHDHVYAELKISSWISVMAGGFFVALSALTMPESAEGWLKRFGGLLVAVTAVSLGMYVGLSIVADGWLSFVPMQDRTVQLVVATVTIAMLSFGAWRYFQAFLFARLASQWAMVVALLLLVEVQLILAFGRPQFISGWLYHFVYALAFGVLFAGWLVEMRRAGSVRVIAEALSMRDAVAQLNQGHSKQIANLVDAIEWKDLYTLGHVRRVASYALMAGKELGLSTLELRNLALAAQMHDVGKIGVPDRILLKPARLTAEEYAIVKQHVGRGYEIAGMVPALASAADGIRYHHEHFDGSGYPEGLAGESIPLQARIVAVADAFDAMTSGRSYQPAISKEAAVEELRTSAGSHFDPRCVEAFATTLGRLRDDESPRVGSMVDQAVVRGDLPGVAA